MSVYTPPIAKARRTIVLAWAISLSVHAAIGAAWIANGGNLFGKMSGVTAASERTTAAGRATRLAEAKTQLEKLVAVQNALEKLKQEKSAQYGPQEAQQKQTAIPQARQAAQSANAQQWTVQEAQQRATHVLQEAQKVATTPLSPTVARQREVAKAMLAAQQVKEAQAKVAKAQETMRQHAGFAPLPKSTQEALRNATEKQMAAQQAQQRVEEQLRSARQAASQKAAATSALRQAEMAQKLAAKMQADANAAQARVAAELSRMKANKGTPGQPGPAQKGAPGQPQHMAPATTNRQATSAGATSNVGDLATAYATAQKVQQQIATTYRDVRATELAQREGISLEEAKKRTDTVTFTPSALPLGKGASLSTERTAQRELAGMVARAERLLDQAQRAPGSGAAKLLAQMRASARQEAGKTQDMTPFMAMDKPANGKEEGISPPNPRDLGAPVAPAIPPGGINQVNFGRRVASTGAAKSDWLSVDTWYTIGPFPNPDRRNIDTPYPPEASVDLDATYPGKNGRTLGWQFVQASKPDVIPVNPEEYGIYYAYTELWFDTPRDLWVAIGSDDKSTLWVEDQLVWMSSDQLKGWQVGEGLRYVHFKQGRNRVLLRCENGWRGVAFSLVLSLKPAKP